MDQKTKALADSIATDIIADHVTDIEYMQVAEYIHDKYSSLMVGMPHDDQDEFTRYIHDRIELASVYVSFVEGV